MQRLVAMNKLSVNLEDQITPIVRKRLEYLKQEQRNWLWQLSGVPCIHAAAGLWQLSGVPCIHAVAGYMHLNRGPDEGGNAWKTRKKRIKTAGENNSQVTKLGKKIRCSNCQARGRGRGSRGGVRGAMGAESGGRGQIGAESSGRGQIGAKSGGRGGMGSGIRVMGTDSGGRGGKSGGRATIGG
ncbi:splicing factor [Tanacetum coccineum]